jgi:hypothetical protein
MRRRFSLLFAQLSLFVISLLGLLNLAFAQKEIEACFNFLQAEIHKKEIVCIIIGGFGGFYF